MWLYTCIKFLFTLALEAFYQPFQKKNWDRIPSQGPTIIYSNHNNFLLDGTITIAYIKRKVSVLVAVCSLKHPIFGFFLKSSGAIPVMRPIDLARKGEGMIISASKCGTIKGKGTWFSKISSGEKISFRYGDKKSELNLFKVLEIVNDEEMIVENSHQNQRQTDFKGHVAYKIIPKVDNTELYQKTSSALKQGELIQMFPEGHTHDHPYLLPFKSGIAIVALEAKIKNGVSPKIVPFGMNFQNQSQLKSKVLIEVGEPYEISDEIVDLYKQNPKEAIQRVLKELATRLEQVLHYKDSKFNLKIGQNVDSNRNSQQDNLDPLSFLYSLCSKMRNTFYFLIVWPIIVLSYQIGKNGQNSAKNLAHKNRAIDQNATYYLTFGFLLLIWLSVLYSLSISYGIVLFYLSSDQSSTEEASSKSMHLFYQIFTVDLLLFPIICVGLYGCLCQVLEELPKINTRPSRKIFIRKNELETKRNLLPTK